MTFTLGNSGDNVVFVDNAQLAVPEPGTWALPGLGAPGLALRQRRSAVLPV